MQGEKVLKVIYSPGGRIEIDKKSLQYLSFSFTVEFYILFVHFKYRIVGMDKSAMTSLKRKKNITNLQRELLELLL